MRNAKLIPSSITSFHTLERKYGFQSICHFYPPDWTADITLYQMFMKGRLWIEAYEGHLETVRKLDHFLGHQKYTYDLTNPWVPDTDEEGLARTCPRNRIVRLNNEPVGGSERGPASIRPCNCAPRLLTNDTSTQCFSLQSRNSNSNSTITNARRLSEAPRQRGSLRLSDVHSRR